MREKTSTEKEKSPAKLLLKDGEEWACKPDSVQNET